MFERKRQLGRGNNTKMDLKEQYGSYGLDSSGSGQEPALIFQLWEFLE
jgi:hypothetical protein